MKAKTPISCLLLFSFLAFHKMIAQDMSCHFERSNYMESDTYEEVIAFYQTLDQKSDKVLMKSKGATDANLPLHLVLVSNDKIINEEDALQKENLIILINNNIHPGEPDGMQACMLLVRNIVDGKLNLPQHVVLAIIPVYNIGGSLQRSSFNRIDQNGPIEKGCRANSLNYDLNRDFIKCDAKESRTFAEIFHMLLPEVFIDNHTSNGADYQHTMTLLTSQHNKLGGDLGNYLHKEMEPWLFENMKNKGIEMIPYVNHFGPNPEKGWEAFWDSPRYSSGYTTLFNTISFVPETHMLKPFKDRVVSTYELIKSIVQYSGINHTAIKSLVKEQRKLTIDQTYFPIQYKIDSSQYQLFTYKGYEAERRPSKISGLSRLYYNHDKPYVTEVKFYNYFKSDKEIKKPKAYIIPASWHRVIDLLKINKVAMKEFNKDTTLEVEVYRIKEFKSNPWLYEGHHLNNNISIETINEKIDFRKGDYYIPMDQEQNRYLIETLEPESPDGFFTWNFFDSILSQKEGFSAYVFEETGEKYLEDHVDLLEKLNEKKKNDPSFANDHDAQLQFIFQHSEYFEKAYRRYPVYRIKSN